MTPLTLHCLNRQTASQPGQSRKMSIMQAAALVVALTAGAGVSFAKGKAEHVVVVVWDGMRPDFITPQYCPNLYALATNGVFFKNNHCAYVSSTEVNGAALATGVHPGRNRVIANTDYRPEISVTGSFATARGKSGAKATALQTLPRRTGRQQRREAFGVRSL